MVTITVNSWYLILKINGLDWIGGGNVCVFFPQTFHQENEY